MSKPTDNIERRSRLWTVSCWLGAAVNTMPLEVILAPNGQMGGKNEKKKKQRKKSSAEPTAVDDGAIDASTCWPALLHESNCYHEIKRAEEKQRALWNTRRIPSQPRMSCQVGYSVKPEFSYHFPHSGLGKWCRTNIREYVSTGGAVRALKREVLCTSNSVDLHWT